ncbi:phosphoinositide-3-kinase-interacting protein 1 [Anolis sagrei]|uniref:phosphoinositide-3-kinase-interacting protein 1 n=1 Tax=Anolis sagrei TaxID=38937 RepID=UPI00295A5A91|nr:phosphoinositide-3-kinase-interacting protein 1 [Anolis sagrei ordinatus]
MFPAEAVLALWLLALSSAAEEESSTATGVKVPSPSESPEAFGPALESLPPSRSEAAAVEPVVGRGPGGGKMADRKMQKKDLGVIGYVLGVIMVVIIIAIGVGIVMGYVYKRARDLRLRHARKAEEREQQRASLRLSAFVNQACEEEATVCEATALEAGEGPSPLVAQAGTPGA